MQSKLHFLLLFAYFPHISLLFDSFLPLLTNKKTYFQRKCQANIQFSKQKISVTFSNKTPRLPYILQQNERHPSASILNTESKINLFYMNPYLILYKCSSILNNTILDESIFHSIFIHMSRNVIGYQLQFFTSIAHCYTYTSLLDDRDVVATIAERHSFFNVQA